jgi:Cu(I)/Ag(I) efflux system membrane fusion protein
MNIRITFSRGVLAAALLGAFGYGAWTAGMRAGLALGSTSPAAGTSDPRNPHAWSVAQGGEATARHLRDGLRAGNVDPVTGLVILNYHDPMVPGQHFDAPGKSPFMDMMLVPRYAGAGADSDAGGVAVSPRIRQSLGLRTAEVVNGVLESSVTVPGQVAWNERDQAVVAARSMGYVEKLHVRAAFDRVAKGAPLADLYVPEWVAAQEEYLALVRMSGPGLDPLREAATQRMRQVGMDAGQIERVAQTGAVQPRITLRAPIGGIVAELMVREGATAMPGMPLLRLQGTASVWAEGQVPESQVTRFEPGARVSATSPAVPGQILEGRVQQILPEADPATRTIRARLVLNNPGGVLVPGMSVQLQLAQPVGRPTLLAPSDAVIHTGRRSVVMLAEEGGHFRPVEVRTGRESAGQTEIVQGLQAGQRVVLSGQFLIDSEASLRGLQARLNPGPGSGADVYRTDAVIDAVEGDSVTLTHPAIAALQWPGMTMAFRLPAQGDRPPGLAPGHPVRIEFRLTDGGEPQITRIERAATAVRGGQP